MRIVNASSSPTGDFTKVHRCGGCGRAFLGKRSWTGVTVKCPHCRRLNLVANLVGPPDSGRSGNPCWGNGRLAPNPAAMTGIASKEEHDGLQEMLQETPRLHRMQPLPVRLL